jgi:hypothetical protein
MPKTITATAAPRSVVTEMLLPYIGMELLAPDVVGPTFTGIVAECDTEPLVSVMVTV